MTFINEQKSKIEISVRLFVGNGNTIQYRIDDIYITPYRKRNRISVARQIQDRYEYRILDYSLREEYVHQEYLKYCTEDQLWEAVQEEYQRIAPQKDKIIYRA